MWTPVLGECTRAQRSVHPLLSEPAGFCQGKFGFPGGAHIMRVFLFSVRPAMPSPSSSIDERPVPELEHHERPNLIAARLSTLVLEQQRFNGGRVEDPALPGCLVE